MNRSVLLSLLLVASAHAQMLQAITNGGGLLPPTLVQVIGCGGVAGSITCTPAAVGGGNTVLVEANGDSNTCSTATGSGYSFLLWQTATVSGSNRKSVFIARNVTVGSTTVTLNCTGVNSGAVLYEFSPQAGFVVAGDVIGSATGTGGTPSVTTTNPVGLGTEEVVASIFDNSNFRTLTAGSGYTMQKKVNDSGHSSNCTTTCLVGSQDSNNKTGLSGTQTASITGISSDAWNMSIVTLANTPAQDNADTYINFEGLQDTVAPTVAQLNASTFGVPCIWTSLSPTNMTGATGSQLGVSVTTHQVGATKWSGSGSLGLAFATGTAFVGYRCTFQRSLDAVSYIQQLRTSLPQNSTNSDAYSLNEIENAGGTDYFLPQIQANGSALHLFFECHSGPGTQNYALATNTTYYVQVNAVNNGGTASMKLFDSSGAQIGTTSTCTAEAIATQFNRIAFGVTGAEPETAGSIISTDNFLISLRGLTLTP